MKTEDFIAALVADTAIERPVTKGLGLRLWLALVVCVGLVGLTLGFRPDLAVAMVTPVSLLRMVLALALLAVGLRVMLGLGRPEGRAALWPIAVVGVAAAGAFGWALIATPVVGWPRAVQGETMIWCLTVIPTLSILPVAVLMVALRRGASTRPRLAGAMAGLAGGGGAAAVYALHCPEDNPLFYVTWYGVAILTVTVVSSVIGGRVLRW